MAKKEKDKIWNLIIDSYYLCYKAFYSLPSNLSFKAQDTNIIYGFLSQVKKIVEQIRTDRIIFCFDSPKSYRRLVYPNYKNRKLDPEVKKRLVQAKPQFVELEEEVLPKMGFKNIFSQNGYESDDLIAEICWRSPDDYVIVSSDEDLFQLLYQGPVRETKIFNTKKFIDLSTFQGTTRLKPTDWVMVKAIAGCSTDTVEGIEGVGEVKAIQYIKGELPDGKIKKRIESDEGKEIIHRNLNLVGLPHNGLKPLNEIQIVDDDLYSIEFMEVFRDYGFQSFLKSIDSWVQDFNCMGGSRNGGTKRQ